MEADERIGFRRPEAGNQVSSREGGWFPISPQFTISEGLLHRHHRRALRACIRTRTRRRKSVIFSPSVSPLQVAPHHHSYSFRRPIADGRLVLRHRRPLTQPYPNAYSHPLPRFRYDGATRLLTVEFENDPAFAGGTAWRAQTFHLTMLPRRRPRTFIDEATNALTSAFRAPLSFIGGSPISAVDPTAAGTDDAFNLREDEVEEQDRGEDTEVDDDPARDRAVRLVGLTPEELRELSNKAWARRRWEVLPLRVSAARHSKPS